MEEQIMFWQSSDSCRKLNGKKQSQVRETCWAVNSGLFCYLATSITHWRLWFCQCVGYVLVNHVIKQSRRHLHKELITNCFVIVQMLITSNTLVSSRYFLRQLITLCQAVSIRQRWTAILFFVLVNFAALSGCKFSGFPRKVQVKPEVRLINCIKVIW